MKRGKINRLDSQPLAYFFLIPTLVLLIIFVYGPAIENIAYSFFNISSFNLEWNFAGLSNYQKLFLNPIFWKALSNNILYAIISVTIQVFGALIIASILESNILRKKLVSIFRTALFLPSILPVTVVGLLWQLIYQPSVGLIDQLLLVTGFEKFSHIWLGEETTALLSIIIVSQWQWTGYMVVLFMVAISAIPNDLYEASRLDGANRIQQFYSITFPSVRESTLILTVITIFGAFKVFDIVWVMTAGGPNHASEVLGTHMYRSAFRDDVIGYSSAVATLIFLITLSIGLVQIKMQKNQ